MRTSAVLVCVAMAAAGVCWSAEGDVEAKGSSKKPVTALDLVAEEERWVFQAPLDRPDVFVDLEAQLTAQIQAKAAVLTTKPSPTGARPTDQPQGTDIEKLVAWSRSEEARIRQLVAERHYEDAMKAADLALKPLEPHLANKDVATIVVSIRTYRAQAEEAKLRDDAQTAFEALKIRVLGVLWSQDGSRMAIIDGENRALTVNDRVKECAVINIDQDRVDFRFVFGRRRFEFPVYVDQTRTTP